LRYIIVITKDFIDPSEERESLKMILKSFNKDVKHLILRIDRKHIEVDINTDPRTLTKISKILKEKGYQIIDKVEIEDEKKPCINWRNEFLKLYDQGRYWEIHEMLEYIWRKNEDDFIRALILLMIPYIKIQMGQYNKAIKAFKRFLEYPCKEETKYGINLECIKNQVRKIMNKKEAYLYPPIDIKRCIEKNNIATQP